MEVKILKKVISLILALTIICAFGQFAVASSDTVSVYVDGEPVTFDVEPRIIGGRTMVPIRAIFEALGADVEWNNETRTATAIKDGFVVSHIMGEKIIYIGDSDFVEMDVASINIGGRILVPARFAAEAFACLVDWDNTTRTAIIQSKEYLESIAG